MKRLVLLLALCLVSVCLAEDVWSVSFKNGFISVCYKGKELFASIDLAAFTPDYKECPFTMRKGSYRQEAGRHVFHHSTEDADTTLTISFAGTEMTLDMNAQVKQMMPFEYGLRFKPDTFALEDGSIYIFNNGRSSKFTNLEIDSFKPDGLSFEMEKASHCFSCEGNMNFTFQDRRKNGGFYRLVGTRRHDSSVINQHIVWKIKEYNDEQVAFRKKHVLAHANRSTRSLSVSNADFEQGEAEWECGPNASFESVDAKHGKSAKMVVGNPLKDPVYITRLVPIVPGGRYLARCQIKTKDVEAAEGKMSSVGACLIVEWADENKKWIAPGVYSKGLWGTSNWTTVECKKLRAPLNAHYASVFIALRGKGSAWYDNFELWQQEESAVKTTPREGEVLHTNAPLFGWLRLDGVDDYTIDLSQSPSFPPEETIQQSIEVQTSYQLRTPLKPGVWYWRVSAPGFEDKTTANFVVDAPQGVNLAPPEIVAQHSRLLSTTDTYNFSIRHTDGITEVKAVDADDSSARFTISHNGKNEYTVVSQKGWRKGLNTIEITATGTNKASETKKIWIVCAPKPQSTIVIDKDGRYTENGKHIFPLGIYEVKPEYMADVKAAGFDVVHTYTWEGSQDEAAAKAYMDAAQAAGIRVFIGFDRGNHSKNGIVQGNFELLARRVGSLAVHPALFCWYLFDEPEVPSYYVPPKQLTAFAELLRKLDPYHPVVMTTWGKSM
ncbi:MAG: hypothetical protein J6X55_17295, partial [Victivallales bacterium]|nr:hypothetical protein [Victivallales bacterium]